jgi:hypothetical protein
VLHTARTARQASASDMTVTMTGAMTSNVTHTTTNMTHTTSEMTDTMAKAMNCASSGTCTCTCPSTSTCPCPCPSTRTYTSTCTCLLLFIPNPLAEHSQHWQGIRLVRLICIVTRDAIILWGKPIYPTQY